MAVVGIATAETLGVQENWSTVAVDGNLFPLQSLIAIQFPVMGFLELKRYQVRPRRALDASRAVPRVAALFPSSHARARERCESAPQPANARVAWGPAPCVRACEPAGRPCVQPPFSGVAHVAPLRVRSAPFRWLTRAARVHACRAGPRPGSRASSMPSPTTRGTWIARTCAGGRSR